MKISEVAEMRRVLKMNNLPLPFGFILDVESFDELRGGVAQLFEDSHMASWNSVPRNPESPFLFMGFWFDRSDVPELGKA